MVRRRNHAGEIGEGFQGVLDPLGEPEEIPLQVWGSGGEGQGGEKGQGAGEGDQGVRVVFFNGFLLEFR